MTARAAFLTLTLACVLLTVVRGRVDGVTVLAAIFAIAAAAAWPIKQKAGKQ